MKNCTQRAVAFVTFGLLLAGSHASAVRPPSFELLPDRTLAYVRIVDVRELFERLDETSMGRILKEQQFKSLSKQLFEEAEAAFQPASEQIGLSLRELLQIPRGEITLALVAPPSGLPAAVLLMDIEGQETSVDKLWALADQRLSQQMVLSTEQVDRTKLTVFTQDDPRWTGLVRFQKDGTQVICSNIEVARQILSAWDADEPENVLSDNAEFAEIMRHSKGPRGEDPQIRWFIDPVSLAKVAFRGNFGAQAAIAVLPVLGLDGVYGLGGSMTFAAEEYDSYVQTHLLTAQPRNGILAALAMKNGDPAPEPWVPHDVASYWTMYWDLAQTQREAAQLFDSFRGEHAFQKEVLDRINERLDVDVLSELANAWDGRISLATWFQRPAQMQDAEYLGGIKLKGDHEFQQVIEKVVNRVGDDLEERTFGGRTYYASPEIPWPPAPADAERADHVGTRICFGIVDDYLLIANRTRAFERGIRVPSDAKSLAKQLDFRLAFNKARRQPGGKSPGAFYFARPEESLRTMYDLALADSTREMLGSQAESNPLLGSLHRALEQNPLPPFSAIEKHLAPTGSVMTSDEEGFHYTGFGMRRK